MQKPNVPVKKTADAVKDAVQSPESSVAQKQILANKQEIFQGPLPPPAMLKQYGEILPGSPERILALVEREQQQRLALSTEDSKRKDKLLEIAKQESDANIKQQDLGQKIGLIVTSACCGSALIVALCGLDWKIVAAFLAVPTAGLVRAFMSRKDPANK